MQLFLQLDNSSVTDKTQQNPTLAIRVRLNSLLCSSSVQWHSAKVWGVYISLFAWVGEGQASTSLSRWSTYYVARFEPAC
jgi:hypothetical protein